MSAALRSGRESEASAARGTSARAPSNPAGGLELLSRFPPSSETNPRRAMPRFFERGVLREPGRARRLTSRRELLQFGTAPTQSWARERCAKRGSTPPTSRPLIHARPRGGAVASSRCRAAVANSIRRRIRLGSSGRGTTFVPAVSIFHLPPLLRLFVQEADVTALPGRHRDRGVNSSKRSCERAGHCYCLGLAQRDARLIRRVFFSARSSRTPRYSSGRSCDAD